MKIKYEISSDNIFADLGVKNPEEALAKSEIAIQIHQAMKKRKLTQKKAAALLGIDQPKVSAILTGKLSGFSLERLFKFLNLLGTDVHISFQPKAQSRKTGSLIINSTQLVEQHTRTK